MLIKKLWNRRFCFLLPVAVLLVFTMVLGCGNDDDDSDEQIIEDVASLMDSLRVAGATVAQSGELEQPFFSEKAQIITVNGGDVQVFEYAKADAAEDEAAKVASDGSTIDNNIVQWVATPHFYKTGNLIVLYVGESEDVMNVLETVLGSQFAGR
ncbi:MAG: hypothetical protein O7D34_03160 [Ignavibacteria bacterium]|nr:hypothetical protein [Ignavibacteria bacterium]